MPRTDEYTFALAIRIKQGQITVNGEPLSSDSTNLPKDVQRAGDYFLIPERALLDTDDKAIFSLHPAKTYGPQKEKIDVSEEAYALIRGKSADEGRYRMCVIAPTETKGHPEEDHRKNKTPVSYLHCYQDKNVGPHLEFQANEGCVRVVLPPEFAHMKGA